MSGTAVYGIYQGGDIHDAVDTLLEQGFRSADISLLLFPQNDAEMPGVDADPGGAGRKWRVTIGALAIPGLGPLIAAGPIMASLVKGSIGGYMKSLVRVLVGLGIPESEARRYEIRIKAGDILLSVHCAKADGVKRAEKLLRKTGAEDVASSCEAVADWAAHQPRKAEVFNAVHR